MLSKTTLVAGLLQALPAFAAVHEKLAALPVGWTATAAADTSSTLAFTIALTQQNIDQLETKLLSVSTPGSAQYGQHMDVDDLNALFAPTAGASDAVESWLKSAGVKSVSTQGAYVTFATTVGAANSLLNTTFMKFENAGVSKIRTMEYSVPASLSSYIDLIDPTVFLGKTVAAVPAPTRVKKDKTPTKRAIDAACSTSITPQCLKELYNVGSYTPNAKSGSRVGFGSFLNQSATYVDLFQYEEFFGIPHQNFSTVLIAGATNDQDFATAQNGEANLDVQNIIGVSHPLPVTEFITGGSPPFIPNLDEPTAADNQNEPYMPYYSYLLSQPNSALPQVISNSYGDDEQTVPEKYAIKVCNQIAMMGLRGITVLESSGDNGVGAPCQSNDGKKTPQFTPTFPASCPYILAVGGTVAVSPEQAWVGSAGGFSNYFERPLYQELAVETYLDFHISPAVKKYYTPFTNFQGRGFPDIAAHSVSPDYQVVYFGELSPSGGTSAASPVVAAIIGLLNDARFCAGKKSSLGFVNPLLYAIGFTALNDITLGQSIGCNGVSVQSGAVVPGASIIPFATWNATQGWDPVTGLGTPNFEKLKALALALP
ncbi:Tripeptidyl-peptidase [Hyphodiscus hymeniophilus]|uniref:tripeptidyl-peptidase II n=1 Tax=Hyphodiscus hymeniophilus TaxID=353542 RepID=A0A9P6SLR4_9HELO|nr:Tripeptidyl-peptidase [Hyphodiscus hymeniophilus]